VNLLYTSLGHFVMSSLKLTAGHGFVTRCYLFATAARVRFILLLYSIVG